MPGAKRTPGEGVTEVAGKDEKITPSSGNVFADLGLDDADELGAKAGLVGQISGIISHRGLTQSEAAKILKLSQADVSRLLRGELDRFSTERLLKLIMRLDRDIEIVIRPRSRRASQMTVVVG